MKTLVLIILALFAVFSLQARPDAGSNTAPVSAASAPTLSQGPASPQPPVPVDNTAANRRQRWYLGAMMAVMLLIAFWQLRRQKTSGPGNINPS